MTDLSNPIYNDDDAARKHLERIRWPNGPFCPHCGEAENVKPLQGKSHRPGLHKCYSCKGHFSVTVGTVFERSKIPLHKWVLATHLMCASKKGMSSKQMERMLGVTYKTAWFMSHRIREAMAAQSGGLMGSGGEPVEADETFVGRRPGEKKRRGYAHKNAVLSLVERNGNVRSFHVPDVTARTLGEKLKANIHPSARVMTDDAGQYRKLRQDFPKHAVVNHTAGEYVRGSIHTNTVEGYFSIFKRGINGIYQHVSSHHLHRYTAEFDFRYNHRARLGYNDNQRAELLLRGIGGKRLTYS